jgi:hypothetical protein
MDSDASTTLEKTPKNTKKHHEKHQNEQAHDLRKQSEDSKIKEMGESILYS